MALQTFNAYSQTDVGVLGNPFGAGGKSFVHCGSNPVATIVVKDDDARLDVQQDTSSSAETGSERGELLVSIDGDTTHAGQDITSSVRFAVTGSDGSSFDAQVVTAQDTTGYLPIGIGGSSFGGHDGASYFVFGQDLIEGVTYSFSPVIAIGQVDDAVIEKQVACFTSGTLIKTQQGDMPIEALCEGDMVLTMDRGYQPIRWIGSFKRSAQGDLAPILVRKGALGNDRDLRVSPQHRMLLQGWQAEMFFEEQAEEARLRASQSNLGATRQILCSIKVVELVHVQIFVRSMYQYIVVQCRVSAAEQGKAVKRWQRSESFASRRCARCKQTRAPCR